ncbi:imidazole glycerol phosphate synthase subunit HisH [Staphylococcus lutrae]|uniref:Imidazole glycerol phosphate synthase subunit HisH n=1 Tax=Staphylococcus lutrae TaxID=155085 RepID=A0AAC9RT65_9STAP|nr:imidazole glycerol phosphate synthase subunit HisH [Staphylococcus lutrae]ARJ50679.1 imidazole glycerol phosphate synthase subunit HisH [Staphylococcus lutrae]PNZ34727.1 imidazole glycerol phosphate synthase subunit HisH [Staphylococcus lutrae]
MIVIVDYGLGNILNVQRALQHLGYDVMVSHDEKDIDRAEQLILPGVGHFKDAMQAIDRLQLQPIFQRQQKPIIGICLGMQLLYTFSEEGHVPGLGFLEGEIRKIQTPYTIPHLGWNQLTSEWPGLDKDVYYVHSYQAPMNDDVVAYTDYGTPIPGIVQHGPYIGIQFHPEKSGTYGLNILAQALKGGWQHD